LTGEKPSIVQIKLLTEDNIIIPVFTCMSQGENKAADKGFKKIILAAFFGKALKMAQGAPHTHAAKSSLTMKKPFRLVI